MKRAAVLASWIDRALRAGAGRLRRRYPRRRESLPSRTSASRELACCSKRPRRTQAGRAALPRRWCASALTNRRSRAVSLPMVARSALGAAMQRIFADMKISVPKERRPHERRVAASPDTVKRLVGMGHEVVVESRRRRRRGLPRCRLQGRRRHDRAATRRGARRRRHRAQGAAAAEPRRRRAALMKRGAVLIGMLQPLQHRRRGRRPTPSAGLTAFAMELVPRITRAQSMDVLSSQANLAGYSAVLEAAAAFGRALPMMMTAAGTIAPARVLVMGAGVAGLQAIATARRLGAIVSATDVRFAAKEQVESLGATLPRRRSRGDEGDGDGRRLCQGDGRGFRPPPARACHRGAEEDRHRHHHRAHPRPARRRC